LSNIEYLNISCNNTYLIDNLLNSLEELILNNYFNLPLNNLPNSIKIIKIFNNNYNENLNNLPSSVEHIKLNVNYGKPMRNIPLNLKLIECHKNYKYLDLLEDCKLKYNLDYQIKTFV
jgi:hypothetical protein